MHPRRESAAISTSRPLCHFFVVARCYYRHVDAFSNAAVGACGQSAARHLCVLFSPWSSSSSAAVVMLRRMVACSRAAPVRHFGAIPLSRLAESYAPCEQITHPLTTGTGFECAVAVLRHGAARSSGAGAPLPQCASRDRAVPSSASENRNSTRSEPVPV